MSQTVNHEIHLVARPQGWPTLDDFQLVETPLPAPAEGQALVRNVYMSVDPYMRGRMNDVKSYTPPFALHKVMQGGAIGTVVASRAPALPEGAVVLSNAGWREYFVSDGRGLERIEHPAVPLSAYLGVLGMPGMTAYVGLLDIGRPQEGETVFVSAASGAVGSVVGQLARLKGCRVVGSAGSQAKAHFLLDDLGFDAAFNYKEVEPGVALREHCPDGVDIYFDNVGGEHLRAAISAMKNFGRIPLCGMISQYNDTAPQPGPNNLALMIGKRLTMQGFLVSDHMDRTAAFRAEVGGYLADGRLTSRDTVADGIARAPQAFLDLLHGENIGKMLVRLAPDPSIVDGR